MEKLKRFSSRLVCAILCVICAFAAFPVHALAAGEPTTVRVGFFAFDGYHMQDADGKRSGYGYELLQLMAGYAGFRYEYIGYDKSWSEMQDMLANGEIDILTSAQKTDDRLERFAFSDYNIGVSTAILTTRADELSYEAEDYSNWNGIRIGMIKGNSRNDGLFEFAAENGFTFEPVYFEGTEELTRALRADKSVDAIMTSSLRRMSGERLLAEFDSSPFYIMVRKGDTELLERINDAIEQMDIYASGFRSRLMNTYYPVKAVTDVLFTAEEREYIEAMRDTTFTAIINPDREPYSYIKDGELNGSIYYGALEVFSRSGLDIEFVDVEDRTEYWRRLQDGTVDICVDAEANYNEAEENGYWQTAAYLEVPLARLYCENTNEYPTVAILKHSNIAAEYTGELLEQGKEITYYDSVSDISASVLTGEQSMALLPINTAIVAVRDDLTNRLISERVYGYATSYAVDVSTSQSPLLFSIINKCLSSLSEQEIIGFSQYYDMDLEKPFSMIGYIYDYPIVIALAFVIIAAIALTAYVSVRNLRKKKAALIQMEKERLQKEELQEALRKAKIAIAAKTTFMSMMSHEMRTPLNAVIGYNTIARNDMAEARTDEERRQAEMRVMDCLSKSDVASRHLLTIINDVLDMSAIESGNIKLAKERFDFKGLVNSLTTIFYTQAKMKGVELHVAFDTPTEEWFIGDQLRTNQILTNLMSNAIKFTAEGGTVKLKIEQAGTDGKNADILFEVSDTGIGMTAEYLQHIWTPFEQADASIARRFGGTGLGLSISKNLVELMGGSIDVASEPGIGTTFRVKLTYARTEQPEQVGNYDFSVVNALVVDDDQSTCDYIRLLLTRFGVHSACATSGEEAVTAVAKAQQRGEPYTVCMVDWRMPKMDGLETIRQIRAIAGNDIPIIVITAYDYSEVADKADEIGVSSFVSKPLFPSSLFNMLANICGRTSAEMPLPSDTHDFGGARVLLVEDNSMNMEIATKILESAGLTVDSAWNGEEAVNAFVSSPAGTYKTILMDVQMPVMDGYQATRLIRASEHPQAKSIPIIAMTADAFAENVAEALASGMNEHISKPIDIPLLFETLDKYIAN